MTIKEFYEWALDVGVIDTEIELQYQDADGVSEGTVELSEIDLKKDNNVKIVATISL